MTTDFKELKKDLSDSARIRRRGFRLAQDLCDFVSTSEEKMEIQELVLRALERRTEFGSAGVVVDGLAREVGLFPYLDPEKLHIGDLLAYECHRPAGFDEDIVFHHPQAVVYRKLLDGENVILSAPTSFGKSLVIDALLATGKFNNVFIIVPTLALIDETRRRLSKRGSPVSRCKPLAKCGGRDTVGSAELQRNFSEFESRDGRPWRRRRLRSRLIFPMGSALTNTNASRMATVFM